MWWKKESNILPYSELDNTLNDLKCRYQIVGIVKPRILDPDTKYRMTVWTYLGSFSYIISIEEYIEASLN